jgi:hypothetical protein
MPIETRGWLRAAQLLWEQVTILDDCWCWTGRTIGYGYGQIYIPSRRSNVLVHRLSYELFVGPILDGLFVLHTCDNPPCVRPSHLFLGTNADNMRDAWKKGRLDMARVGKAVRTKSACANGHELDEANTYRRPGSVARECRECRRLYQRDREKRRAPRLRAARS